MKYKGFAITKVKGELAERCPGYWIKTPDGKQWDEIAASIETARKWIDCELAARLH